MVKTDWYELKRLKREDSTWYKRRVFGPGLKCSTCGRSKLPSKAFYEYAYIEPSSPEGEFRWDGQMYCNRKCMPKDLLRRYNRSNKTYRDPSYGKRRDAVVRTCSNRVDRLVARLEEMGRGRGSITKIAKEEGVSRQRVHQLLEKRYGRGNVLLKTPAAGK